jgi:2,3-bisphosphoglycerate-independent phosphoglycerate mutase
LKTAMIFIDGLGLGEDNPEVNPLAAGEDFFADLAKKPMTQAHVGEGLFYPGVSFVPVDAVMGVPGLPQSATGQTSLFTGVNAQMLIGRHLNGFPSPRLRQVLQAEGIFYRLSQAGKCAVFANAFTDEYFQAVQERKRRYSASTVAAMAGDQPLRKLEDLRMGRAVFQDITRETLIERGYGERIQRVEAREAGAHLAAIIKENDFTLFEYFQTDRCGHKQDPGWARRILGDLSDLLSSMFAELPVEDTLVVIASDHGNLEALDRKTHTVNPVPVIVWGKTAEKATRLKDLTDVMPLFLEALSLPDSFISNT